MKILITGASGFIGKRLIERLKQDGHTLIALARSPENLRTEHNIEGIVWDASSTTHPPQPLPPVDAVIHLAGEPIAGFRWSEDKKKRIRDTRVNGTRNLIDWTNALPTPPKVFISTSAIGFYGSRGDAELTEESAKGHGFLADVCEAWENEAKKSKANRLAIFRFGVVLGPGGMLSALLPLFKKGLGGKIGSGDQWMSWIQVEDLVELLATALTNDRYSGVFNAVAPATDRNSTFTETLGRILHRPTLLPVPAFAMKLALGQMAEETALASQRALPHRVLKQGFTYRFNDLESALKNSLP